MFLRPYFRRRNGQRERIGLWSSRTAPSGGLGNAPWPISGSWMKPADWVSSMRPIRNHRHCNVELFSEPRRRAAVVEIDRASVRGPETATSSAGWWRVTIKQLGLHDFSSGPPAGQEHIPWSLTALIWTSADSAIRRAKLHIAENLSAQPRWADLLGVPSIRWNDQCLYRGLDALLPAQGSVGRKFLKQRFGRAVRRRIRPAALRRTSTYFEGQANANPLAKRGYSRDHSLRLQASLHRLW